MMVGRWRRYRLPRSTGAAGKDGTGGRRRRARTRFVGYVRPGIERQIDCHIDIGDVFRGSVMDSDRFSNEAARIGEFRRRNVRHVQCRSCGFEPVWETAGWWNDQNQAVLMIRLLSPA